MRWNTTPIYGGDRRNNEDIHTLAHARLAIEFVAVETERERAREVESTRDGTGIV